MTGDLRRELEERGLLQQDAGDRMFLANGFNALTTLVAVKGDEARLLPVDERSSFLFGKDKPLATGRKKKHRQLSLFEEMDEAEAAEGGCGAKAVPRDRARRPLTASIRRCCCSRPAAARR
jgi:hypothetical protein